MFYDVPKPTEALLITGGLIARKPENPYRIVTGGGAWSIPVIHRVQRFYIGARKVNISVRAQSKQNVDVDVDASIVFSVIHDKENITYSANKFLGSDLNEIVNTAEDIFSGETRAIIGQLTVEEMISDRLALASQVVTNAEPKMLKFGWQIDSFQINSISDPNGYISALSAPELARVEREKAVAEAKRDAEISEEQQKTNRQKSDYQRETDMKTAENKQKIAEAVAEANAAGPMAEAKAQLGVTESQSKLAEERAALRERELVIDVIKPAEADADKRKIEAEAEAEALRIMSDATATNDGIVLDKQMVDQMPEVIKSLAEGLNGANITIVGDNDDLVGFMTKIASSAPALRELAGRKATNE